MVLLRGRSCEGGMEAGRKTLTAEAPACKELSNDSWVTEFGTCSGDPV